MGRNNQGRLQRVRVISTILMFIGALAFVYTNCGGTTGAALYDSERGIFDVDSTSVILEVGHDPIYIERNDKGINIGGECDTNLYPSHDIAWSLSNVNGGASLQRGEVPNSCINKRFNLYVRFPASINYDAQHVVDLSLRAKGEDGDVQVENKVRVSIVTIDN